MAFPPPPSPPCKKLNLQFHHQTPYPYRKAFKDKLLSPLFIWCVIHCTSSIRWKTCAWKDLSLILCLSGITSILYYKVYKKSLEDEFLLNLTSPWVLMFLLHSPEDETQIWKIKHNPTDRGQWNNQFIKEKNAHPNRTVPVINYFTMKGLLTGMVALLETGNSEWSTKTTHPLFRAALQQA